MLIEEVKISDLTNHPRNAKKHSPDQIRLLEKSIKRFGWTQDVIISSDNIIAAGHARVQAAINLGMDTVPCKRTTLTGAELDAYLIADNRITELGQWDRDILAEILEDLPKDLSDLTGFDPGQIDDLIAGNEIEDVERFISESDIESEPSSGEEEDKPVQKDISIKSTFEVIIECEDEVEQESTFNTLSNMGYKCRVLTL